jgi:hypothetical protein
VARAIEARPKLVFSPQAFLVADATIGLKVIQGSAARRGSGSIVAAGD